MPNTNFSSGAAVGASVVAGAAVGASVVAGAVVGAAVGAAHADRTRAAVKMMLTTNHNRLDLIIILLQVNVQGTDQEIGH